MMKAKPITFTLAAMALAIAGCTTVPTGPSHMALPGSGKSFDQFQYDDASCRQYALQTSGGTTATDAQTDSTVKSAALGTALGAVAGAAIGNSGQAAGVGAGLGLLMGAAAGAGAGNQSAYIQQRRYDDGYTQCMYAKGHRVAVSGRGMQQVQQAPAAAPQPAAGYPPPPAGIQPPPPQYYPPPPPGSPPPPPSSIMR